MRHGSKRLQVGNRKHLRALVDPCCGKPAEPVQAIDRRIAVRGKSHISGAFELLQLCSADTPSKQFPPAFGGIKDVVFTQEIEFGNFNLGWAFASREESLRVPSWYAAFLQLALPLRGSVRMIDRHAA